MLWTFLPFHDKDKWKDLTKLRINIALLSELGRYSLYHLYLFLLKQIFIYTSTDFSTPHLTYCTNHLMNIKTITSQITQHTFNSEYLNISLSIRQKPCNHESKMYFMFLYFFFVFLSNESFILSVCLLYKHGDLYWFMCNSVMFMVYVLSLMTLMIDIKKFDLIVLILYV